MLWGFKDEARRAKAKLEGAIADGHRASCGNSLGDVLAFTCALELLKGPAGGSRKSLNGLLEGGGGRRWGRLGGGAGDVQGGVLGAAGGVNSGSLKVGGQVIGGNIDRVVEFSFVVVDSSECPFAPGVGWAAFKEGVAGGVKPPFPFFVEGLVPVS